MSAVPLSPAESNKKEVEDLLSLKTIGVKRVKEDSDASSDGQDDRMAKMAAAIKTVLEVCSFETKRKFHLNLFLFFSVYGRRD